MAPELFLNPFQEHIIDTSFAFEKRQNGSQFSENISEAYFAIVSV
jgi:hypothetical protein